MLYLIILYKYLIVLQSFSVNFLKEKVLDRHTTDRQANKSLTK